MNGLSTKAIPAIMIAGGLALVFVGFKKWKTA